MIIGIVKRNGVVVHRGSYTSDAQARILCEVWCIMNYCNVFGCEIKTYPDNA